MGDINGVAPEILLKLFSDDRILKYCTPIIYGSNEVFSFYKKLFRCDTPNFKVIKKVNDNIPKNPIVCVLKVPVDPETRVRVGEPSQLAGAAAGKFIKRACEDLKKGYIDAIVTSPISKSSIQHKNFSFLGHTEFLQGFFNASSLMMMCSEDLNLRIATVTTHIPIAQIAASISRELVCEKLELFAYSLRRDFNIYRPKIAVLGLNPHAGDMGIIGKEEEEIIIPAIKQFNEKRKIAYGPYPSDGFFGTLQYQKFDGILAMYHDQALIPFKLLDFNHGVNFTAGLPVVRTSPDHGTGFGIAGTNQASTTSTCAAIFLAISIIKNRLQFALQETEKLPNNN